MSRWSATRQGKECQVPMRSHEFVNAAPEPIYERGFIGHSTQAVRPAVVPACVCVAHKLKNPLGKCSLPLRLRSKRCATLDLSRRLRMDGRRNSISSCALDARLGSEPAPIIVGARHDTDFAGAKMLVADAAASRDSSKSKIVPLPCARRESTIHRVHLSGLPTRGESQ